MQKSLQKQQKPNANLVHKYQPGVQAHRVRTFGSGLLCFAGPFSILGSFRSQAQVAKTKDMMMRASVVKKTSPSLHLLR